MGDRRRRMSTGMLKRPPALQVNTIREMVLNKPASNEPWSPNSPMTAPLPSWLGGKRNRPKQIEAAALDAPPGRCNSSHQRRRSEGEGFDSQSPLAAAGAAVAHPEDPSPKAAGGKELLGRSLAVSPMSPAGRVS